jgi:putative DNA primase/helicase
MLSRPDRQIIDDTALEFLRLILPDRGPYVAMIVESKQRKYNKFASTIEALWEIIKAADSAGHTVYHACASFKEAKHDPRSTSPAQRQFGRTQCNASGAKALWLDVDAGPGKPYADWKEAAGAVAVFCQTTGLPPPLCIMSGSGWHVYWPLEQTLDPETWERYACGLQALCVKHGLHVDSHRTTDISSVLRTPGTHHRKKEIRQVQLGRWAGLFPIETFRVLLDESGEDSQKRSSGALINLSAELPAYLASRPRRNLAQRTVANLQGEFEPSSGAIVVEHCEQVRALRDKQGGIPEPDWYAVLSVLAFTEDGELLAHEWSSGDPRYSKQETQERLDRAQQFGPTTCTKFHDLNSAVCERCPCWQKIKSPIVLGQQQRTALPGAQAVEAAASQTSSDKILIDELANLSILAYDRRRKEAAKQLGIGVAALDKVVDRRRSELEGEATSEPLFAHWTVEPWPEPVDGDALMLALVRRIQSHVVMIPEAALTVALWIIFTWVHAEVAIHSPILMVTSAEANCGKSTLLGIVGFLARRALASVGISPAALYRSIEKWRPTLIIDETDGAFVQNEDLRTVVNSGWTRGQGVLRCEGDDHELKLFATFCPKAIGLKGKKLPDTTASRALVVELKRKLADEKAADFRHVDDPGLHELRQQLLRWANDNVGSLPNASPSLPHGFSNRVAANWHLLLAIADVAGGCWPEKAREAAAVIAQAKATLDASIGIQLLEDIRTVFNNLVGDRAFSKTLIERLISDPEKPWGEYNRGKPFTQKQLGKRLGAYGITSETVWIDGKSAKGYKRTGFEDTWTRYLSA